uniref:Integrase catalytic domain-containing protein n=1 Tax=Amphimedon queenslandica TaxID=400682 RepID=A0A1X7VGJ6_AMPQE
MLLAEVYGMLKFKGIRTTPYHPQTDGLVERFNGTLKRMLHSCTSRNPKECDTLTILAVCLQRNEKSGRNVGVGKGEPKKTQGKRKVWYDQKARDWKFGPGDEVFVMLPSSTHNLTAEWMRPFKITRAVGEVNYKVEIGCGQKAKLFHINMLKQKKEVT